MTKIFSEVRRLPEFEKDFKRLLKKLGTLEEDLQVFIEKQLNLLHKLGQDNRGCVRISGLDIPYPHIYKARKFACKSLKGKGAASGIRVIYAYYPQEDIIEFIEIYYKGEKANEDRKRILQKYKQGSAP
jgi:mRNA-degrading endonuclease RelE of RelBE toxin-antitoxin system